MPFALSRERESKVDELLTRYPTKRAVLLPLLHLCQEQNGWVSSEVIDFAAKRLELPTSEVQGVVTFYTMYHQKKVGKNVVWVCRTLSCDLRGAKAIEEHLEHKLGCHAGETSADGEFTLLRAECLAACGAAPMVQINDEYYENLTTEKLDEIIEAISKGRKVSQSEPKSEPAAEANS